MIAVFDTSVIASAIFSHTASLPEGDLPDRRNFIHHFESFLRELRCHLLALGFLSANVYCLLRSLLC